MPASDGLAEAVLVVGVATVLAAVSKVVSSIVLATTAVMFLFVKSKCSLWS